MLAEIDFVGPLNFGSGNLDKDKSSKVYICLFPCALTRAVHLELCRSLNAQDFLLAFRRFAGWRGLPTTITSDNARTFKSSSKEIRRITRSNKVLHYLVNQRISWTFITERAPWWGGFLEWLVKGIKTPLKKVLDSSRKWLGDGGKEVKQDNNYLLMAVYLYLSNCTDSIKVLLQSNNWMSP